MEKTMDKIVALAKSRGFVYPGSEIYGGLANTWDYGNLGVELKNNVKRAWWQKFIQENPYNVGVDCAILMNPQTWVASGHLGGFSDPLMDCKECHERFRADKIIEDFKFAFDNLPEKQADLGRANKYAAAAYLAKANLYKAYRQNEKYEVTSIDAGDLEEVVKYTGEVLKSSYGLETDFAYNFMPEFENGKESIFAIQFSKDDGTMFGNLNFADFLSVPQGLGCCDFHKPSQNLVNAFKTSKGLPMFKMTNGVYSENYDIANYSKSKAADPRLFSTVAMDGFPYKYNEDLLFQNSWNRNPEVYGNFASLKENVDPSCDCFVNLSPYYANSMNKILIRFADVLLMRAEALIELNRESEALPLINQIRQRAQDSANGMVNYSDPDLKPVMEVALYQDGSNCVWNQEFARYALRWERRLEFAMENMRFFDLVRWGICSETMNKYFQSEKARRSYLKEAVFTKNKNEYAPIPQQQIGYSKDVYKQNYGWK